MASAAAACDAGAALEHWSFFAQGEFSTASQEVSNDVHQRRACASGDACLRERRKPLCDAAPAPLPAQAHAGLGACLYLMVTSWAFHILADRSAARAYAVAGAVQLAMGAYLLLWVFVLVAPGAVRLEHPPQRARACAC